MADATRDNNRVTVAMLQNEDGTTIGPWLADHSTGYALVIIYPASTPTAINTYANDKNRVHPLLLEDDSSGAAVPWLSNSAGGAWITIS